MLCGRPWLKDMTIFGLGPGWCCLNPEILTILEITTLKYSAYLVNYYGMWTVVLRENLPSARALVSSQPYGSRNQASGPPWPTRYIWPHSGDPRGGLIPVGDNSRTYWFPQHGLSRVYEVISVCLWPISWWLNGGLTFIILTKLTIGFRVLT